MKNLLVFLFACCVQAVSASNATWRFGASGANIENIEKKQYLWYFWY